ncbi:alpha/beta fold hydrolase [Arthrobacter sp.]|uniref:alpha/beta fold hydrolase n=1 Tax=Arthrobacter sp. TaxID=1667 RepID=UPI003A8D601D
MTSPWPHLVRRGAGTPLLFLHGNGVDHRLLLELDDAFATGGWERIHLDLPGFGSTPRLEAPGGLPELADWLDDAVTALVGTAPFAVVGSSLGGLLARDLAARRSDQLLGLALLAPVVDPVTAHRTLPAPVVLVADAAMLDTLDAADRRPYAESAVIQTQDNWQRFRRAALPGIRAADLRAMARLGQRYALAEAPDGRLSGYERPVLIIAGKQDAVVGFEDQRDLASLFPHSSFALLDGAGHNLHLDQPDLVRALLVEWAARVRQAPHGDGRPDAVRRDDRPMP